MIKKILKRFLSVFNVYYNTKKGTTFESYLKFLKQIMKKFHFNTVLEFGPGKSTKILSQNPDTKIISFETNKEWYDLYKSKIKNKNINLKYRKENWDIDELLKFSQKYQFIFVDGGDRVHALKVSKSILDNKGIVFLHDAHREEYEKGIKEFSYYYFCEKHSCMMFNDKETYLYTKKMIPPNENCHCKYCSSKDRLAYFKKMKNFEVK